MRIRFLEIAEIELDEAVRFYNHELPGLGDEFLTELMHPLDRIARCPEAWHPCSKRTRRYLIRRFPYGVIYRHKDDEILVVAVANLHRKPDYWQVRFR